MSDHDRLRDKLGKLSAGGTGAEIDARSEKSLLRGLAQLIDDIVLPREVTLSTGRARVVFTVARRRLIGVAGDVTAQFDEDETADQVRRLRSALVRALRGPDRIEISARRAEIAPELQGAGPSVEALAAAWGVDLYGTGGGVGEVAMLLRDKAYAWVSWEHGAVTDEGGDPEYIKVLKDKVSARQIRAQHGGERGLLTVGGNSFATAIGLAWEGQTEAGFVVARIDLGPIAKAFSGA